jgi:hypothetical protein
MLRKPFILLLAALMALAWGNVAFAQQHKNKPRKQPTHEATTTLTPRSPSHNPCAQYGAGFTRMPGSDTCIRIGGSVGVEGGGRF